MKATRPAFSPIRARPHVARRRALTVDEWLYFRYLSRACWTCARLGDCPHREPNVELAYLERERRRRSL